MALLNALQALLNMGGQPAGQQATMPQAELNIPGLNLPKPGPLSGLANIMDAVLSANPNYQRIAMGQQQLRQAKNENENAPLQNALNNMLKQAQIQFMPTKYNLQQQRLDIDNRRFSPEQLKTLQEYRQSLINTAPQRVSTAEGKHVYERNNLEAGYAPGGNTWQQATGNLSGQNNVQSAPQQLPLAPEQINKLKTIFPQPGQDNQQQEMPQNQPEVNSTNSNAPFNNSPSANTRPVSTDAGDFIAPQYVNDPNMLQYDMLANKKVTTEQTRKQFEAARQLEGFVNKPETRKSLIAYAQYAGLLGQGDKFIESLKTTKPELYKRAMEAEKVTISNFANLQRRLENLGVQEKQREEIRNNFDGAAHAMRSDPDLSLSLINAALRQMNEVTSQIYATAQPIRKVYSPHEFKPLTVNELNAKTSTNASKLTDDDILRRLGGGIANG